MRKNSYIRLALLALPLSLPAPAFDEAHDFDFHAKAPVTTTLGSFLESEVENRIEKVSGHKLQKFELAARSIEIAMALAEASYVHKVDPFLLLSMIEVESRYDVTAVGLHGELGLMQIKPSTARWIAPISDELYNCDLHGIRCNIMMGASYVGHLQNRTGTRHTIALFREHVLRSYNLGPARANRMESARLPATEFTHQVAGDSGAASYASKIAKHADRLRSRYLAVASAQ